MKGHGEKMTRKKDVAIMALLTEPTIAAAAKKTGVAEATLFRWLRLHEFQESYKEAKRQAVGAAIACLQRASSDAVAALQEITNDKEAPATSRVSAARSILELAVRAIELEDVLLRLERLENEGN
jgi:transposase-like protein